MDAFHQIVPDWRVKENFGTQVIGGALNVDVLDKSHAVAALPRIPYYPITMFDALTSVKGECSWMILLLLKVWEASKRDWIWETLTALTGFRRSGMHKIRGQP